MTEKIKKGNKFLQCFNFSIQQHVRKLGNLGRAPSCPLSPSLLPGSQPYAPNEQCSSRKKVPCRGPIPRSIPCLCYRLCKKQKSQSSGLSQSGLLHVDSTQRHRSNRNQKPMSCRNEVLLAASICCWLLLRNSPPIRNSFPITSNLILSRGSLSATVVTSRVHVPLPKWWLPDCRIYICL